MLIDLILKSWRLTKAKPAAWFLSLMQFLAIFNVAWLLRGRVFLRPMEWLWLLLVLGVVGISSLMLWQDIEKRRKDLNLSKRQVQGGLENFDAPRVLLRLSGAGFMAIILILLVRRVLEIWSMLTLVTSLIIVSLLAIMLALVLLNLKLSKAVALCADLWTKSSLVPAIFSLFIMLLQAIGLAVVRSGVLGFYGHLNFEVSLSFATIVALGLVVLFFLAVFSSFINHFAVLGFWETIKTSKNNQLLKTEEQALSTPIIS